MSVRRSPPDTKPTARAIVQEALPSLTGIRGIAALWVTVFHLQFIAFAAGYTVSDDLPIIHNGFRGLDLFFILSGFIMMHVHHDDFRTLTLRGTLHFFALRAVRVYPLNVVALLLILAMVTPLPGFVDWYVHYNQYRSDAFSSAGFWQTLILANRWMPSFGEWNGPTWSLSVEWVAYAIFPALAFGLVRERSRSRCLVYIGCLFALLAAIQVATGYADKNMFSRIAIVRVIACFPAGVALCRLVTLAKETGFEARWAGWVASGSAVAMLVTFYAPNCGILAPFCFAGMIGGLAFQHGFLDRILRSPVPMFLGEVSFPLYIIQYVPITILEWLTARHAVPTSWPFVAVELAVALGVLLVAADVLHRLVEMPSWRAGRRLVRRWLGPRAAEAGNTAAVRSLADTHRSTVSEPHR